MMTKKLILAPSLKTNLHPTQPWKYIIVDCWIDDCFLQDNGNRKGFYQSTGLW